jgi:hypothetical protein
MTYRGHVKNGQIALDSTVALPEGAAVNVEIVANQATDPSAPEIWTTLLGLAGTALGLPSDMAENHDHYLYGITKKQ